MPLELEVLWPDDGAVMRDELLEELLDELELLPPPVFNLAD